jgi:DNA-binding response OmpR family regulator
MKTVWLVDDDEEMSTAISLLLKLLDYKSRSFLDAPSAVEALMNGERPDLVMVDLNMPYVSGQDFLQLVRSRPEFKQLPILMISSEFSDLQVHTLLEQGADGYITKPATLDELEQAIKQVFEKRAGAATAA